MDFQSIEKVNGTLSTDTRVMDELIAENKWLKVENTTGVVGLPTAFGEAPRDCPDRNSSPSYAGKRLPPNPNITFYKNSVEICVGIQHVAL